MHDDPALAGPEVHVPRVVWVTSAYERRLAKRKNALRYVIQPASSRRDSEENEDHQRIIAMRSASIKRAPEEAPAPEPTPTATPEATPTPDVSETPTATASDDVLSFMIGDLEATALLDGGFTMPVSDVVVGP